MRCNPNLTKRELQVLQTYINNLGESVLVISCLGIKKSTFKTHMNHIMAKLDANTKTQAVLKAIKLDLVVL